MSFTHHVRVRYAEVDAQGVVFNELWTGEEATFDIMVRSTAIDFAGAAHFDEEVAIAVAPVRLGTSSFDLRYVATVGARPAVTITTTYVVVVPGEQRSQPIPDDLRRRLEAALAEGTR